MPIRWKAPLAAVVLLLSPVAASALESPQLLSPGDGREEARVATACPMFSWTEVEGARGYTLVVYRVGDAAQPDDAPPAESVLRTELPARADSWTPSLEKCLQAGRYAWIVGALEEGHRLIWSGPGIFRVIGPERGQPSTPEQPERLSTLDGASAPLVRSRAVSDQRAFSPTLGWQRPLAAPAFAPDCAGVFTDVPIGHPYCAWIEKLAADQIAGACATGRYCPDNPVTRGQLAMFMERSMRGTDAWRPEQGDGAAPKPPPGGPTLTSLDTVGGVAAYTSITIGADGLGLISFYDSTNGDLKVAHCSNVDCTSATLTTLDDQAVETLDVGQYTSITIGADGLGLISYIDSTSADLKVAHCSYVNCSEATITSLDTAAVIGSETSITIGADARGLISYYSFTGDLKVAHCSELDCTSATITPLDTTGDVGGFSSITIGADGFGLISYHDFTDGDLKVAHCSDLTCSTATITPLDTAGVVGYATSITVGADGLGLISYGDQTNADLKIAHCSDVNCTAATTTPLDTAGAVGYDTSITVGADRLGLISYFDADHLDLKVAHCSNVDCTEATMTPLDTVGEVGLNTSITLGADGLGLISYFDITNADLKVAHCSNVLCAPFFRRR